MEMDPIDEVEIAFGLVKLVFPDPGDYRVQLYADGQFLGERRFLVIPLVCSSRGWGTGQLARFRNPSFPAEIEGLLFARASRCEPILRRTAAI